jgi:hypothetical protein
MAMRGKGAAELAATVRAVSESTCHSGDALGFWTALGFHRQYGMIREGFCVLCYIEGHNINVSGAFSTWMQACVLESQVVLPVSPSSISNFELVQST